MSETDISETDIYDKSIFSIVSMTESVSRTQDRDSSPLLEVTNIEFYYNKKKTVLKDLNFKVYKGEIIGISGENGAGKSTFLKTLVGILKPKKGKIVKNGILSYSPQNVLLFDNLTVLENFRVFGKGLNLSDEEVDEKAKEITQLLKFEQYIDTLVKDLSGGTAQKTNFGISLLGEPDILVLDEPYQGLDYSSFIAFWDIQFNLREAGKSIIIVSHLIEDQSKFTRSLHLIDGKLQGCNKSGCPLGCDK